MAILGESSQQQFVEGDFEGFPRFSCQNGRLGNISSACCGDADIHPHKVIMLSPIVTIVGEDDCVVGREKS